MEASETRLPLAWTLKPALSLFRTTYHGRSGAGPAAHPNPILSQSLTDGCCGPANQQRARLTKTAWLALDQDQMPVFPVQMADLTLLSHEQITSTPHRGARIPARFMAKFQDERLGGLCGESTGQSCNSSEPAEGHSGRRTSAFVTTNHHDDLSEVERP